MFEQLSDKIRDSFKKLSGQGHITESNIQEALREIRLSLLEADVNFKVVKNFTERVKEKALGEEVIKNINAREQFIKIVQDELTQILGGENAELNLRKKLSIVFLVGLQGVGKTTTTAKLALHIRKVFQKKPGLISVDVYRPAAMDQLKTLAKENDLPCFPSEPNEKPKALLKKALKWADQEMVEVLLVDTAGRLQIDSELMTELSELKSVADPSEILLVADAMLGQQSVNVAEGFHEQLDLTGLVLTKVDGDARGGAALSIRETTGIPIKFLGVGEKAEALEVFHPDRLASRILDKGDVVSLVEKAQEMIDEDEAKATARKMARNEFTVEDFLQQIRMMKKMGGLGSVMNMLPGMGALKKQLKDMAPPDDELKKIEAIICSMTPEERHKHKILNGSRRLRIAKGSGTEVSDVNRFMRQFEQSKKMMSRMMKMGMGGMNPFGGKGGFPPF